MGNFLWFCAELLFLLSLSQALETGQVKVVVPSSSMLAIKDSSIVLPCHLEPETSAAGMEVRWFKGSFTDFLYLHKNGKETVGSVYKGRVSLVHPDLEKGNVSLLLKDITASDEGIYTCHVSPGQYFDERSLNMLVRERVFECSHPVRLYLSVIVIPAVLALFCFWASLLYAQRKKQDAQKKLKEYDRVKKELHSLQKVHGNQTELLDAVRQIPSSVWNRICESKADVTLDPETAQATLSMSEDEKTVTLGEKQAVLESTRRFEQGLCVLGRNVFTSGRHYWEVEVGEKTHWSVGVAKESAKRSGKVIIHSERGFWALKLSDEKFFAATNPETLLPLSLKPRKLGVYLDYGGGQVSFYNVEARVHIYTFSDFFTVGEVEPSTNKELHPFFGAEKQCRKPLTISPVDREAAFDQPWAQIKAQTEALYKKSPEAAETDTSQTHQEKDKKKEKEGKSSEAPSDTPVQTADYKNPTFSYKNECQSEETAAPPALEDDPEASSPAGPGGTGTAEEKDTEQKSRDSACEETALLEKREPGGPAGGETGESGTTPTGKDKSKGGTFSLFPKKSK